jgi:hypothetical protein
MKGGFLTHFINILLPFSSRIKPKESRSMGIEDLLEELEQKRHQFLQMGGPDGVKKHEQRGRL